MRRLRSLFQYPNELIMNCPYRQIREGRITCTSLHDCPPSLIEYAQRYACMLCPDNIYNVRDFIKKTEEESQQLLSQTLTQQNQHESDSKGTH